MPNPTPRLIKIAATVAELGLNPASPCISFKYQDKTVQCIATIPQVEQAWGLRNTIVSAALLSTDDGARVLWMEAANNPPRVPTIEQTIEELSAKWGDTLRALTP